MVAAALVALLGIWFAGKGQPGPVDGRIGQELYGLRSPWRDVAHALDWLGEPVGSTLLVGAVVAALLVLRQRRAALVVVGGVALAVGTATLLKHVVGRTIHGPQNLSYPSGHTAFLTALALAVAMAATRRRQGLGLALALTAGALMGWAQVTLGAHYPSDVFAGWCTALAAVPAVAWLVDRTLPRTAGQPDSRTAGQPDSRTAGQPDSRTAGQPSG
ncbi:phosphatase PAP2 family protein [Kitasatospora sp. NPDC101183]|uniref:phosphatase PAP2 family protein n=1 Tax=Kitasatospora sp. NPDC101183 TaxID=3364100 RepID=UPI0037F6C6FB